MAEFQNPAFGEKGPSGAAAPDGADKINLSFAPQPPVGAHGQEGMPADGAARQGAVRQAGPAADGPLGGRGFSPDPSRAVSPPPMVPVQSIMAPSDLAGSKQYILSQFLGSYCLIDSLIGTGTLMRKEGYLYEVGVSYIVLFSDGVYTVCDLDSIRYAAFTSPGNRSAAGPARGGRRGGL